MYGCTHFDDLDRCWTRSFDDPILSPKEPKIKQEIKDDIPQNNRKRNQITQEYERKEFDLKNKKPSLSTKKSNRSNSIFNRNNTQFEPQSYRLILILRGVNPSAPSEFVTRALIEEGIQFEVERIERFKDEGAQKRLPSKRNEF